MINTATKTANKPAEKVIFVLSDLPFTPKTSMLNIS